MSRIFERTTMTIRHEIECNACGATAPLIPTSYYGNVWMNPHGWVDLGRNRHVCPRKECLKELANNDAAVPARRPDGREGA